MHNWDTVPSMHQATYLYLRVCKKTYQEASLCLLNGLLRGRLHPTTKLSSPNTLHLQTTMPQGSNLRPASGFLPFLALFSLAAFDYFGYFSEER